MDWWKGLWNFAVDIKCIIALDIKKRVIKMLERVLQSNPRLTPKPKSTVWKISKNVSCEWPNYWGFWTFRHFNRSIDDAFVSMHCLVICSSILGATSNRASISLHLIEFHCQRRPTFVSHFVTTRTYLKRAFWVILAKATSTIWALEWEQ